MIWLHWQMASLGPMNGQLAHFSQYDLPEEYALERYSSEVQRLYGVLDGQLSGQDWIAGDYSIADMACYPWIRIHEFLKQDIAPYPNLVAWRARMSARPGVTAGYAMIDALPTSTATIEERFLAMKPSAGAQAQAAVREFATESRALSPRRSAP